MSVSAASISAPGVQQDSRSWPLGSVLKTGTVALQFALVALVFTAVRLESEAFRQVLYISVAAFPINHFLPLRFRLPFFVLLSVGIIIKILGVESAAWVFGIGLVFIGLCHVPAPVKVRVGLVAAAALALATFRAGWVDAPWPGGIWPILGAMFMFRMIVYLYDLSHQSAPTGPWRALAYFFMIPNVCFPLFPVVDYQAFCRTYYNEDAYKIYQTGIKWMLRGALHFILYRFIYTFLLVGPEEIQGAGDFFQHMVTTYLLYLQVSAMFHTIIGLLHLFGFNLPETNHHYVLASSFTDFWRRINIYWKDFMMKVFFYPLFFRLRKRGTTQAMILATLIAFFATWFLHAYQWYWLRGAFLFTTPDVVFWLILGVLVTLSVWAEARSKKKVVPASGPESAKLAAALALKTVATFLTITFLWSLWTSESLMEWKAMLLQLRHWDAAGVLKIGVACAALAVAAVAVGRDQWMIGAAARQRAAKAKPFDFWRSAAANGAAGAFIVSLALAEVQSHLSPTMVAVLESIEAPSLNARDEAALQGGYYEDLIQVDRFNPELQAKYSRQPKDYFDEWRAAMNTKRDDYLGIELTPSAAITYAGVTYTTNEWGMRDKPYTREKQDGVCRVGIIGSSHVMGWGVNDGEVCDAVAEARLNAEGLPCELLNFSVNGYDPIQKTITLRDKMLDFDLDAAFLFCHRIEKQWIVSHLVQRVKSGLAIVEPRIQEVLAASGATKDMSEPEIKVRLSGSGSELLRSFTTFAEACREQGIQSVWIFMPEKGRVTFFDRDIKELFECAEAAGFDQILDYSDAFKGYPEKELAISDYDDHPNALAHSLLAHRIFETIKTNDAVFAGGLAPQGEAPAATLAQR
ncbi:MAG: hypothetical protein IT365_13580 [Candidatus Hydrogenedentes bacterium]|nr:hypothetical protein [Candidatus Hydrogenedentota bacterium]